MPGRYCIVTGCNSSDYAIKKWRKEVCCICSSSDSEILHEDCACLEPFRLLTLPRNRETRKRWLENINRTDFNLTSCGVVCSLHFIDGKPTKLNPIPTLNSNSSGSSPQQSKKLCLDKSHNTTAEDQDHSTRENIIAACEEDNQQNSNCVEIQKVIYPAHKQSNGDVRHLPVNRVSFLVQNKIKGTISTTVPVPQIIETLTQTLAQNIAYPTSNQVNKQANTARTIENVDIHTSSDHTSSTQ